MNERKLAFLYSPEAEALSYPPDCPFKTQRAGCTRLRLKSFGLLGDGVGNTGPCILKSRRAARPSRN